MSDSRWLDPEIDGIFDGDPELIELAHSVRAARPEPPLDPRFQGVLRAQLMREAPATLGSPTKAAQPRTGRPRAIRSRRTMWWRRSTPFAWAGAGLGVALVAAAVLTVFRTPVQDHQVTANLAGVAELHAVSPNNVITVAFNEPMDRAAVVAGLHIRPATQVTTSWQGNNLLITPTHHLAGNTPYTVTIDHSATRSSNGQLAASDIHISFGTAPTPPPAPSIAQLSLRALATVSDGTQLISAGDGTVIATSSPAAPTVATSPSSSPSSTHAAATSPTTAATSAGSSPTATPPPSAELVSLSASGTVTDLGPAASSAALAPNGLRLVAAVTSATGTTIQLVPVDGSERRVLATLAVPVLATGWLSSSTALVAEADRIVTVDLLGHVTTLATLPPNTTKVIFSATGGQAFAGGTTADGELIDLSSQLSRPLPGSRQTAAFSGDGTMVGWVDATATPTRLLTSPVSHEAAATVPLDQPTDTIGEIALDQSGSHMAVVDQSAVGGGELDVLALPSGTVIARGPQASNPVFSMQGNRVAFVSGGVASIAAVPGTPAGTNVNALPDGAAGTLKAFIDAQVEADSATLQTLSAAGVDATASTPPGLSRAYVISAVSNPDATVTATARLIVDPSARHAAASFVDESLGLSPRQGGGYMVSSLGVGALHDEPIGPHVISVVPATGSGTGLVLRVSFDSDLRASSVASAITVTTRKGDALTASTVYDPNTRTATVTVLAPADTTVRLTVDTTLIDVDGQALAGAFSVVSGG